jgi:glycosyltransferase involved in cell wall biosynthesis
VTTHGRRVLFVDHAGVLGGAEFSLLDLIPAFMPGAAVHLLADGPFRAEVARRGVPVDVDALGAGARVRKSALMASPAAVLDILGAARRLARRAAGFELIYANSQKAFVVSALAHRWCRQPVAWHLRDILAPPHFSGLTRRVGVALANRYASRVIANSRATAAAFLNAGGNPALVRVVHNGIDAAPFDAVTDEAARTLRASLGVGAGDPLVVHVGRFHAWKGQQVLVRALAMEPRARAWIVGAPLFGEEAFARELSGLVTQCGVADRVNFLGFRQDVPALLRAADIVVHSSTYPEPFGRVVLEGMLARKPVVASNTGGVPEIIHDGEDGVLVPPDDPAALASAIGSLLDQPARASKIAARGAARARERFTRAAMVRGVVEALEPAGLAARTG